MLAATLGIVVGLVLGLTGAGGSIFAVPLLMGGMDWDLSRAAPVALLAVCAAAALGTFAAWDVRYVRYRAAMLMASTGLLAAPLGLAAGQELPVNVLTALFAVVLVWAASRMFRQARRAPIEAGVVRASATAQAAEPGQPICRLSRETSRFIWTRSCALLIAGAGAVTGFLAGLLGVGGGFVIVPALRAATQLSMHSAVATSLMAIALTSGGTVAVSLWQGKEMSWLIALPFLGGA
jgi:uncharacterized membrane protein YfcA